MPDRIERIECAIARYWPDFGAVCRAAAAQPVEVQQVVARLEEIELTPARRHDCRHHPSGSLACYDEHNCHCPECLLAVNELRRTMARTSDRLMRAHAEYERLRKAGAEIPSHVRALQRAYDLRSKRLRIDRATQTPQPLERQAC